jgi:YD repeat-containing protein
MARTTDNTIEIFINSATDKVNLNDTVSKWTTFFEIPIEVDGASTLAVHKASILNSLPNFHADERTFRLNSTTLTVDKNIVFTSATTLATYLISLTTNAGFDITFAIDADSQRLRITNNDTADLVIDLADVFLPFWEKMGFKYDDASALPSITLPQDDDVLFLYLPIVISTQCVYIVSNAIVPNSNYATDSNRAILCSIDFDGGFGRYNCFDSKFLYKHDLITKHNFNSMSFEVLDDKYRPVDMFGGKVGLSLILSKI